MHCTFAVPALLCLSLVRVVVVVIDDAVTAVKGEMAGDAIFRLLIGRSTRLVSLGVAMIRKIHSRGGLSLILRYGYFVSLGEGLFLLVIVWGSYRNSESRIIRS
jgi:hypothetical protein